MHSTVAQDTKHAFWHSAALQKQLQQPCVSIVTPMQVCLFYKSANAQHRCTAQLPKTQNMLFGTVLL